MKNLQPHLDNARSWCARAERSAVQVLARLQQQGCMLADAEQILHILQAGDYQSDARLAHVYARSKCIHSGWGPTKVRHALRMMGVGDDPIAAALAAVDAEQARERLHRSLQNKWDSLHREADPYKRRAKVIRFLQQRGFSLDDIFAALRALGLDED